MRNAAAFQALRSCYIVPVRVRARLREGARISEERATSVSASAGAFDRLSDARLEDVLDILACVDGRPQSAAPLAEKKEIVGMQLGVTCGARCARKRTTGDRPRLT